MAGVQVYGSVKSTAAPVFLSCRTGHSGILYGCHLVPQLWHPPPETFLVPPLPLLLCHAQCITHSRWVLKRWWWAVPIHPLSGVWADQPLQLGVKALETKWEERIRCHRNQIYTLNTPSNRGQHCWYCVQRGDRRHGKKQWVGLPYGVHTPEQHRKACDGVPREQNPNQQPKAMEVAKPGKGQGKTSPSAGTKSKLRAQQSFLKEEYSVPAVLWHCGLLVVFLHLN